MVLSTHALSFVIRLVHVASMAYLLGGGLLLWGISVQSKDRAADGRGGTFVNLARRYEGFFWLAAGLTILTGVGNLGVFGAGLPTLGTSWGIKLSIKLSAVLLFLLLSLLRTLLIAGFRPSANSSSPLSLSRAFQIMYAATALYLVGILALAISLAHA